MDFQSSFVIVAWILSFIILVVILVALFYKPSRKFRVSAKLSQETYGVDRHIDFTVENIGKKKGEVVAAFIKFRSAHDSVLFDLRDKLEGCHLPIFLDIGEKYDFEVPWKIMMEKLEKKSFNPISLKVIVENAVGMEFESKVVNL